MPELPEVEVVRRGLAPYVEGAAVTGVEVFDPRALRRHVGGAEEFMTSLRESVFEQPARRGKFMWIPRADRGDALVVHLGMSGQLRVDHADGSRAADSAAYEGPAPDPHRHLRVRITLDSGASVGFVDQRLFGGLHLSPLVPTADGFPAWPAAANPRIPAAAQHIARDLLDPYFDQKAVVAAIRTRKAPIKSLLLAQDLVSGIGNIYADEALWEARVHYARPGSSLAARSVHRVLDAARDVMERALAVGGTSFDALYVNVDGRSGYFARSLNAYGREGMECRRCGTPMVRELFANRSSTRCPRCQRPGRRMP